MNKRGQSKSFVNFIQAFLATVAITLTLGGLYDLTDNVRSLLVDDSSPKMNKIVAEQARLKEEVRELRKQFEALTTTPMGVNTGAHMATLESTVQELERRFSRIERTILQDPAKSLELPMLRKDLEKSQEIAAAQMTALRQDIERTYTLITGTMIALALAVLAPALSNLFSRARQTNRQGEEETPNSRPQADS